MKTAFTPGNPFPLTLTATALLASCHLGESQAVLKEDIHNVQIEPAAPASDEPSARRRLMRDLGTAKVPVYGSRPPSSEELELRRREERNKLQELAEGGHVEAQKWLAEDLLEDGDYFDRNDAEAYKWALIALAQGDEDARYLVRESDLFMSPEERRKGRALADQYIAGRNRDRAQSQVDQTSEQTQ